jgi:hypothetical protein
MELTGLKTPKNIKKWFRQSFDRPFEWRFALCLQQKCYGGVGVWLKDAGRGLQESPKSREIADIE